MTNLIPFKNHSYLTMGLELELQLVNLDDFNLAMEAEDFLRRLSEKANLSVDVKPEITQSMIEINSSIHKSHTSLWEELKQVRQAMAEEAQSSHLGICGGGTHPFQKWKEQRIYKKERFANIADQYGFLAKQFTIFGQHIHIACPNGDDALYLCHAMARYIPQFIVLAAASPFNQGVDTSFDCSRLANISAFPLSGTPPWILKWDEFTEYFSKMSMLGIASSMKDFYWDIRPKPEFGTVEIRVCDTPLTIKKAMQLTVYAQMLVGFLLDNRPVLSRDIYLTYLMNRFRAARYGFDAIMIDPIQNEHKSIVEDILQTASQLNEYATQYNSSDILGQICESVSNRDNGAQLLRKSYQKLHSLNDVVRLQTEIWMNE